MNKKEAKNQYLRIRLEDPNVEEWEKKEIRKKLGINKSVSKDEYTSKTGDQLLHFVYTYLDDQLLFIRRKKRTNEVFDFLPDNLKTIYHLSMYSSCFEDDSLEQLYEYEDSVEDMKKLSQAFRVINRDTEAALINSVLSKGKIKEKDIERLQEHFWESGSTVQDIEKAIENYIFLNIEELLDLQNV